MAPYDIVGNIAIVKFKRGASVREKKNTARDLLKQNRNVTTILEKSNKFSGRLRIQKTKFIGGLKTKEALYRENGCEFRLNVDTCYFSPRLASERKEIALLTRKSENVLVMFGGVGPFAIVIARLSKAKRVVSVELGRECTKYAEMNVKRNKLGDGVEIVQGDVRKKVPKLGKFERIVMARPNLKDSFLDVAFKKIIRGGMVHYYGFYSEDDVGELGDLILREAKKAGKKVKIVRIKKAGDIGTRRYRYRADVRILN